MAHHFTDRLLTMDRLPSYSAPFHLFTVFFMCSTFDMDQQSATKWVETIRPKHSENKIFMYYVRIDAHWTFHYTLYSFTSCVRRLSLSRPLIDLKESVQVFRR